MESRQSAARYSFARGMDYPAIVAASEKVSWSVDGIFANRGFDASKPIVPASWVGTEMLEFLDADDQRTLNHCRAFSYVHLLGNFEEFVPRHLTGILQHDWDDDHAHLRALLRFGEEEFKHQQLFQRAERVLEESCGHSFGRHFDREKTRVSELTRALLGYPELPRFLIVLALEWGTQRHYLESIHEQRDHRGDPLYVDLLKAHWVEEAQHTKVDMLEIAALATAMSPAALSSAFDELLSIGALVDAAFASQAYEEGETLARVRGRGFSDGEANRLREALHRSLSTILAGIGLMHPRFTQLARELSPAGAAKLGIDAA